MGQRGAGGAWGAAPSDPATARHCHSQCTGQTGLPLPRVRQRYAKGAIVVSRARAVRAEPCPRGYTSAASAG